MKFQRVEVSGITEVLFKKRGELFTRHTDDHGVILWRSDGGKELSDQKMLKRIKGSEANPKMRLWIHGETLNIERVEKSDD